MSPRDDDERPPPRTTKRPPKSTTHEVPDRDKRRTSLTSTAPWGSTMVAGDDAISECIRAGYA